MNVAFIISSAIDLGNGAKFNFIGKKVRSVFSAEERFEQTQFTLSNIDSFFPDVKKYIFDVGKNSDRYKDNLSYVKNLDFISIEKINKEASEKCITLQSKGWCESIGTYIFLENKKDELKKYDFLIKISGRYFYKNFNKKFLTSDNLDKILSKKIYKWNWKNSWGFPEFLNQDGILYWMPTTTYCIPRFCFETYKSSIENIKNFYEHNKDSNFIQIDFEAIMFHFLLKDKYFIETDWTCEGLGGVDGKLSVY